MSSTHSDDKKAEAVPPNQQITARQGQLRSDLANPEASYRRRVQKRRDGILMSYWEPEPLTRDTFEEKGRKDSTSSLEDPTRKVSAFGRIKRSLQQQAHAFLAKDDLDVLDERTNQMMTPAKDRRKKFGPKEAGDTVAAVVDEDSVVFDAEKADKHRSRSKKHQREYGTFTERLRDKWQSMSDVREIEFIWPPNT
ncbi:unnamed protein product [Bursaphelenchus okinawaensis]|uniref:Uncharacterized protein n=1 Tax=Bursaphelenchus okinawaensis TaxID=465554 RepID=A0A811KJJ9_9BILA|nr:unnamed protein product [Bursaphelenchus okinawaensis]CAG9105941.1 unnamed protein product [Bursaphelenchus okinawaensis]